MSEPALARRLWHRLEAINAVTYFAPECRDAPAELGLKGFWMGYFACRAAPMGPVGPDVVEATFFNFHPSRVRRAIPDAWHLATPADVLHMRATAAAAALRRVLADGEAEWLADTARPVLRRAIERASPAGRPLFAANRFVDVPDDPVAGLWQAAATMREHRGDGHVNLLAGAGLDGLEAHVLFAAEALVDPALYLGSRGWSEDDWNEAVARLAGRGLVTESGQVTRAGRELRLEIEGRTDDLAARPFAGLEHEVEELIERVAPATERIVDAGDIVFPNPMGLPRRLTAGG